VGKTAVLFFQRL